MATELMSRILKLLLVLACLASIEAEKRTYQSNEQYDLTAISLNETVHEFIDIPFSDSKVGTTEFMVLSKGNGNARDKWKYIAEVQDGDWNEVVYGGDDDRCIHIFERFVTTSNQNNPGKINTKGGAKQSALFRVAFEGKVETGESSGRRIDNEKMTFTAETEGCYFFVYGGDNGGVSKDSDTNLIYKEDDPTSLYFGYGTSFTDESFLRMRRPRRGAVAGVKLTNRPDICSRTQITEKKKDEKTETTENKKKEEKKTEEKIENKPVIEDASTELEEDTVNRSTQSKYGMGDGFLPMFILFLLGGLLLFIVIAVVCSCLSRIDNPGMDTTTLHALYLKKKNDNKKKRNAGDSSTIASGGESTFRNDTKQDYDKDGDEFEDCREFEEYL